MRFTQDFIEAKFNEYNTTIFRDELPQLPLRLVNSRTDVGKFRYLREMVAGKMVITPLSLDFSVSFDLPQAELEDTIIHEMIHYTIAHHRWVDTSAHGKIFRQLMASINERFGRHITISRRTTFDESPRSTALRPHYFAISQFDDGTHGITVCAKTRIFDIYRALKFMPQIKEIKWYFSSDPYFNRYRNSLTAKVYKIVRPEEGEAAIAAATPLSMLTIGGRLHLSPSVR